MLLTVCAVSAKGPHIPKKPAEFFTKGYCIQTTATTAETGAKSIRAFVDGKWQTYALAKFPPAFMKWNIDRRLESLEAIKGLMKGGMGNGPELAGPHNGVVATYGYAGQGSLFKLNNAVKGMGFLPRADKIDSILTVLKETAEAPMPEKLAQLEYMYHHASELFDLDRQVSLELYAEPQFLTQSYTNQMVNPVSTIVFLDIPSYKLKTIARLLDPSDPKLTDYEKKVVEYINRIHSYFHGKFDKEFIAVIYYVIEVFDNSPGKLDARGLKIVP